MILANPNQCIVKRCEQRCSDHVEACDVCSAKGLTALWWANWLAGCLEMASIERAEWTRSDCVEQGRDWPGSRRCQDTTLSVTECELAGEDCRTQKRAGADVVFHSKSNHQHQIVIAGDGVYCSAGSCHSRVAAFLTRIRQLPPHTDHRCARHCRSAQDDTGNDTLNGDRIGSRLSISGEGEMERWVCWCTRDPAQSAIGELIIIPIGPGAAGCGTSLYRLSTLLLPTFLVLLLVRQVLLPAGKVHSNTTRPTTLPRPRLVLPL